MLLIREVGRLVVQVAEMAVRERNLGVVLILIAAAIVVALSATVTTAVPVVIYPFL